MPANVLALPGARKRYRTVGGTFTAGMSVYVAKANRLLYPTDSNVSAEAAESVGVATTAGVIGQTAEYVDKGPVSLGVAVAAGVPYFAGAAVAGDIAPPGDLAAGWFTTLLGVGAGGQVLNVHVYASRVAHG